MTRPCGQSCARVCGFANAHYHSEWFKVAGGEKVRVYWADGRFLVPIPPKAKGAPVLMEVNQPESFIQMAWQAWA